MSEMDFKVANIIRRSKRCFISDKTAIAELADISYPTLLNSASNLKKKGALEDDKELKINNAYHYFLGIAISFSHMKIVVIDYNYDFFIDKHVAQAFSEFHGMNDNDADDSDKGLCLRMPNTREGLIKLLNKVLRTVVLHPKIKINGIGLAFSGVVNDSEKKVITSTNWEWFANITPQNLIGPDILRYIYENGISLAFNHNAKASSVAEKEVSPNGFKEKNIASLYMGSGIGVGLVLNDQVYKGANNSAGEIGHTYMPAPLDVDEYPIEEGNDKKKVEFNCPCGKQNCIEQMVRQHVFGKKTMQEYSELSIKEIPPDKFTLLARYIAYIISLLVNTLSLDAIVINGRFASVFNKIWDELMPSILKYSYEDAGCNCAIRISPLERYSPAVGAAICANYELNNSEITWQP